MINRETAARPLRCAIYTRKSHDEGLDQAFNSLDAQREAALDYIRSQKHAGWQALTDHYDDGGYSGGNMQRPALKRLLEDIERGKVDAVVVYKVDRLSRSLNDFARMMQTFDDQKVSFVSVTQQFNTTNSMGRLTLNMLLSFAQFEREVTGERIRDKIAATKKQGRWVGGQPPLGYRFENGELVVLAEQAELVQRIYRDYANESEQRSLLKYAAILNQEGHTTKRWVSSKGVVHGGKPLTPKYLHRILTNPLYRGRIVHRGKDWKGRHATIIEQVLWDQVQQAIATQDRKAQHRWSHPHLLKGKLRTHEGFAMSPSSVHRPCPRKQKGRKRRVHYYVSQKGIREGYGQCPIKTLNAKHLDDLVRAVVLDHLPDQPRMALVVGDDEVRDRTVRDVVDQVVVGTESIQIDLSDAALKRLGNQDWPIPNSDKSSATRMACCPNVERLEGRGITRLSLQVQVKRLDGKRRLLAPDGHDLVVPASPQPEPHLVLAIGQAFHWKQRLENERMSTRVLAADLGLSDARIHTLLGLTLLSPAILSRALNGDLPARINLKRLLAAARLLDWTRQWDYLGLGRQASTESIAA
ncbi:MAG: recombinase family protein [Planctomycetota bacterium]